MTPGRMAQIHAASFTLPRPWSEVEFAEFLDSPLCFALSEDDGFVIGRCVAGESELLTLAVAPEARRGGLGARLVSGFLQKSSALGADHAFLEVADSNADAQRLYTRAGFAITGRRRGYYAPTVDAVLMSRSIRQTA